MLNSAVAAVALIAVLGAVSTYAEKYLTTNVGQWVMHDLRLTCITTFSGCRSPITMRRGPAT